MADEELEEDFELDDDGDMPWEPSGLLREV
jgi:hypothetical protein